MMNQTNRRRFATLLASGLLAAAFNLHAAPAEFSVTSPVDGNTFTLSEARGKYVALHFLLKTECPFCLKFFTTTGWTRHRNLQG